MVQVSSGKGKEKNDDPTMQYRLSDSSGRRCKTDVLRLRLTPQEKQLIERAAALADETLSSFVYEAVLAKVRRLVKDP